MTDSNDWVVDCSDDEIYSDWETVTMPNGGINKRPKDSKIVELYLQIETGSLAEKLSCKIERNSDFNSDSSSTVILGTNSSEDFDFTQDTSSVECKIKAESDDDFGFQDDYSDANLDQFRQKFHNKKERAKPQVTFDNILKGISRNRKLK